MDVELAVEMGPNQRDIPRDVDEATLSLVGPDCPMDPVVVMDVAAWWYRHGGASNPVYRWSVTWLAQLIGDRVPEGNERYLNAKQYLEELGYET